MRDAEDAARIRWNAGLMPVLSDLIGPEVLAEGAAELPIVKVKDRASPELKAIFDGVDRMVLAGGAIASAAEYISGEMSRAHLKADGIWRFGLKIGIRADLEIIPLIEAEVEERS